MIVAGTGSRSLIETPEIFDQVMNHLIAKLEQEEVDLVIVGMAEGFDECLAYAAMGAQIPFHAYIPNDDYGNYYWRQNPVLGINRHKAFTYLTGKADEVKYICDTVYVGGKHSNLIRNEAMVDAADILWVWDPSSAGTKQCMRYAKTSKKPYEVISV